MWFWSQRGVLGRRATEHALSGARIIHVRAVKCYWSLLCFAVHWDVESYDSISV